MRAISLEQLETSLSFWENAGYVALASVIFCCFVEYLHVKEFWHKEGSWWTEEGGAFAALLLVVALASEMFTQFRTNEFSGRIIAKQSLNAAITEERLLGERRLTANERWRLERVERAVLPRSLYVNWPMLVADLRVGKFQRINIALISPSMEASEFASDLMSAFQKAGIMGRFFDLSHASAETRIGLGGSSSGVEILSGNSDANKLGLLLWQKFQIGGGAMSATSVSPSSGIPNNQNCLVVDDNNWAESPGTGQPGEGSDKYGGADPAPH